jgi:integrase
MASANVRYWRGGWVVDVSKTIDGKRQRSIKSFGPGSKAKVAAEAYRDEIAPQAKAGKFFERQTITFKELWQRFETTLASSGLRASTIADYKAIGRLYLEPLLGAKRLVDIDAETIMEMKAALLTEAGAKSGGEEGSKKPLSARSVGKILTLGGTIWRYGRLIKVASDNPFADVKKPRVKRRAVYVLSPEEIGKLRAELTVPFERLIVEIAMMTGLRSGELRALRWDSVDLKGKRVFIERSANRRGEAGETKTENSLRTVPVPEYLIPELTRWKLACPVTAAGLVFPGEPNEKGERGAIDADVLLRNILRRALARAGLPPLRFHDLRHLYGSLMHEAGVPLKVTQDRMGHASERTTIGIYTHAMKRKNDDSADRVAALAGLAGNKRETNGDADSEETSVSA